jgi:hypothetical protein
MMQWLLEDGGNTTQIGVFPNLPFQGIGVPPTGRRGEGEREGPQRRVVGRFAPEVAGLGWEWQKGDTSASKLTYCVVRQRLMNSRIGMRRTWAKDGCGVGRGKETTE